MNRAKFPTTEQIARQVLHGTDGDEGLALEVYTLTTPANDNQIVPWQMAEKKLLEMAHVCSVVAQQIQQRDLRPYFPTEINDALDLVRPA